MARARAARLKSVAGSCLGSPTRTTCRTRCAAGGGGRLRAVPSHSRQVPQPSAQALPCSEVRPSLWPSVSLRYFT